MLQSSKIVIAFVLALSCYIRLEQMPSPDPDVQRFHATVEGCQPEPPQWTVNNRLHTLYVTEDGMDAYVAPGVTGGYRIEACALQSEGVYVCHPLNVYWRAQQ